MAINYEEMGDITLPISDRPEKNVGRVNFDGEHYLEAIVFDDMKHWYLVYEDEIDEVRWHIVNWTERSDS